jgi:glycosyltransferase involved in cell wall biosynthesis
MKFKTKPSLVVDARLLNASGIGTVCQNTLPLLENAFEITLIGNPKHLKNFTSTAAYKTISFKSEVYSLQEQVEFFLKVPPCDYFFSPHYNIPVLPIKAKRRIVIIHDVNHIALAGNFSLFKKLYAKVIIKCALGFSDKIFTVSEFSKAEISKYFKVDIDSIHTISLGVNKNYFRIYPEKEQVEIRSKYQLPAHFLLYVGNVKPHKNLITLVRSFALLKAKDGFSKFKLVIVGKKEGFITGDHKLESEIKNLNLANDIIFTGYVENEDLPLIYNIATLFVFPSIYEGFGLPPVEAMACGCPTVVSSFASMPEVCQDAALYFNPLDPEDLAKTISAVLNNESLQNELRRKGLQVAQNYEWEATAQKMKEVILSSN